MKDIIQLIFILFRFGDIYDELIYLLQYNFWYNFFARLLDHSILLKARHDELIHKLITTGSLVVKESLLVFNKQKLISIVPQFGYLAQLESGGTLNGGSYQ